MVEWRKITWRKNMKDFERSKIDWLSYVVAAYYYCGAVYFIFFLAKSSLIKLSVRFVLF